MKKISVLIFMFLLSFPLFLFSCKNEFCLADYVSEAREDILLGESENYNVKSYYGYTVKSGNKQYFISFMLTNIIPDETSYSVNFILGSKEYNGTFSYNPTKSVLSISFNIEKLESNTLDITVIKSSEKETLTLKSLKATDTVSIEEALSSLYVEQKTYIDSLILDGTFNATLTIRLVERNGKNYYYIGITDKDKNLKAMLMDGKTKELLAIKKIV